MASDTYLISVLLYLLMVKPSLQQCPSACRCPSGTEVRCINKDLPAIPPDIPVTVEKLYLDRNRISEVNRSRISALPNLKELYLPRNNLRSVQNFANLPNLEILSLASNNISYFDDEAFQNSTKLKYIFLDKNRLVTVPTGLERLDNLQILTLSDNNIRTVNATYFSSLTSIVRIDLHNNPWSCDCHLRGLKEWMSITSADISLRENVTCASPEHLIGRAIDDVHVDDMVCATTATVHSATTKGKTTTTNVHSASSTIVYSSPSVKVFSTSGRTTDTHSLAISTKHHPTTGSKDDQTSRTIATKSLMPFKSTSDHRVIPSRTGKGDDDKDDLIWIICVSVLGTVLLIVTLIYLLKQHIPNCRPPGRRPEIYLEPVDHINPGYRPDAAGPAFPNDIREDTTGQRHPEGRRQNVEEKVVTAQQLRTLATKLGAEWEQLSTELGFTLGQLYQFRTNNPHNVQQAMFVMLDTWCQNHGREATIGRLVQHMMNVNVDVETYGFLLR